MAEFRMLLATACSVVGILIAAYTWVYNGYQEDFGSPPLDTVPFALPWSIATGALVGLVCVAIASPLRRERFSWYAVGVASLMAAVLAVFFVAD